MLSLDRIEQVRSQTHVSTMDAVHALTVAGGDVTRAIDELNDHAHAGNRSVMADSREHAQQLAAALVDAGIWFECETTAPGRWRFSVAVGAYPRLRTLNSRALDSVLRMIDDAKEPVAA
jgi:hypothetical protein